MTSETPERIDRIARALWGEMGADYTYEEAIRLSSPDTPSGRGHISAVKWVKGMAKAAIRADLAGPKVKALKWCDTSLSIYEERLSASTIFGADYVCLRCDRSMTWSGFIWGEWTDYGDGDDAMRAAKAAAQADYDRRIKEALE